MLKPIQKEHELICPCGCGVVIGTVDEIHEQTNRLTLNPSLDIALLGSALENHKYRFEKSPTQFYEEQALRKLYDIVREFGIPESFAFDAFNELKRKNRGFRSETAPIKQLIKILSKDDNYIYFKKLQSIKIKFGIGW